MSKLDDFYDQVYSQDTPDKEPCGRIQWKGTDVCIDLYCKCGEHSHVDAEFFYNFECPHCHAKYAVGQIVKLIPLNAEQIAHVESGNACPFIVGA